VVREKVKSFFVSAFSLIKTFYY